MTAWLGEISPVTLAVATTAAIAALLFVAYDVVHSIGEQHALDGLLPGTDGGSFAAGILQRGLVAFAVALLAIAVAFRRRAGAGHDASLRRIIEGIVGTVPVGIAVWTGAGDLVVANAAYRALLGAAGKRWDGPGYGHALAALAREGELRTLSNTDAGRMLELHRQDGSCLSIDERPLQAGGFVTLVSDITERKRADDLLSSIQEQQRQLARRYHEEKLKAEAASRAKTSFLAHLSHDIRTPLNHIIGFADLIRHQTYGPLGDARYLGYVDTIKASGEKLLGSFATILELAELESGNRPLREEDVSIDALLRTVSRRFANQASRAGIVLATGAPCGAVLKADRFCLERMLGNLVENAIRFTTSGGRVTLAGYAAGDGVVLEVSDTGIGMTQEQLELLSQPFVFGDAAFTREHDGAGLGVAISRAIAELSGGRLAIDSSPTLGTTVAVALPLGGATAARSDAA